MLTRNRVNIHTTCCVKFIADLQNIRGETDRNKVYKSACKVVQSQTQDNDENNKYSAVPLWHNVLLQFH